MSSSFWAQRTVRWEGRGDPGGIVMPFRFGVNFSYYGQSLAVAGLGLNLYQTQLLFGAVELPSKLLVYVSVRHAGRRLTQAGTLLGAALALGIRLLVASGEQPPQHIPLDTTTPSSDSSLGLSGDLRLQLWLSRLAFSSPEPIFLQREAPGALP